MSVKPADSTPSQNDALSPHAELGESRDADFSIQLFGSLAVRCGDHALPHMRSRKEQWLLALLVLHAREKPIERLWLAGTLWPESHETRALFYLRRSLSFLREALGESANRISSPTPRTLFLDLSGAECDVAAFDDALLLGDEMSLQYAAELYRGDLLLDCAESWVLQEREKRARGVLVALERLAKRAKTDSKSSGRADLLRRILEIDPLRESALRELMETLAADGNPAAAGEAYRTYRTRLWRDHNSDPDAETVRLNQRILAEGRKHAAIRTRAARSFPSPDFSVAASPSRATKIQNTSIPSSLSPLIGRQSERESVIDALASARLVTLTGMGGVGKTRLSLAVAESLLSEFTDGVWFVDLTAIDNSAVSPNRLAELVFATIRGVEDAGQSILTKLISHLRPLRTLIVLDNCEHLIAECARFAHVLLRSCPSLHILTTSREALRVSSEVVIPVPRLGYAEASQLFAERAAQATFTFQMNAANAAAAARICDRLDGIPLAIEIAAARTRGMSAARIANDLDSAFRLLNLPGGSWEPRHQTLRATLNWSFELLSEAEQSLLGRLSIFAGGWTLEAAEAVCGADGEVEESVVMALLGLVDKSLVVYSELPKGEGRYILLEMTREYAGEKLDPRERPMLMDKLAEFFAKKSIEMRYLQGQLGEHKSVNRFEPDLPNVRIALQWCRNEGRVQCGLRLAGCLGRFWLSRGHIAEGRQCVTAAIDAVRDTDEYLEDQVIALMCLGILAQNQRDIDEACRRFAEALPLAQALDADTHTTKLFPDPILTASVQFNLGVALMAREDRAGARQALTDALALWTEFDAAQGIAKCRYALGQLALADCDFEVAETYLEQALGYFEASGNLYFVAHVCFDIASVVRKRGAQSPEQRDLLLDTEAGILKRVLTIARTLDSRWDMARALASLAHVAACQGRFEDAGRLYGASETLRESVAEIPFYPQQIEIRHSDFASGRDRLGSVLFNAALEAGRVMTEEEAVADAMGI